jgi:hypothetical protein
VWRQLCSLAHRSVPDYPIGFDSEHPTKPFQSICVFFVGLVSMPLDLNPEPTSYSGQWANLPAEGFKWTRKTRKL